MKPKIAILGLALSSSVVVFASYRAFPAPRDYNPDRIWLEQGINPTEGRAAEKLIRQFSSDVRHNRPVKDSDWQKILQFAQPESKLSETAYWTGVTLCGSKYQQSLADLAAKAATEKKETKAFAALSMLQLFRDPRWRSLAMSHKNDPGELFALAVQEAQDPSR